MGTPNLWADPNTISAPNSPETPHHTTPHTKKPETEQPRTTKKPQESGLDDILALSVHQTIGGRVTGCTWRAEFAECEGVCGHHQHGIGRMQTSRQVLKVRDHSKGVRVLNQHSGHVRQVRCGELGDLDLWNDLEVDVKSRDKFLLEGSGPRRDRRKERLAAQSINICL